MRSSYCGSSACIDVQTWGNKHIILTETDTGDDVLIDIPAWNAFVAGVKAGDFDCLTNTPKHNNGTSESITPKSGS